jgi:HD-like signal output (HDOD) protein
MADIKITKSENTELSQEANKGSSGPYSILFYPDPTIWNEARKLVADKNTRVEDIAVCASQDPAIVIELLKTANALYFSAGKTPITSVKTSIIRLGSDVVLDILLKMQDRQVLENTEVRQMFEFHRNRARRVAIMARLIGEALSRTLSEDCLSAGLMMGIGDMLAVAHLKEEYLEIAHDESRTTVLYRLVQDHKFDVEKIGLNYLRKQGIPEALIFALDRDTRAPSQDRAIMKPICQASAELVDAFDNNKWEKFAPGKPLPPKSAIRTLGMNDPQYLKIYERASEFLFASKLLEEKKKALGTNGGAGSSLGFSGSIGSESPAPQGKGTSELESEITQLLRSESSPRAEERAETRQVTRPSTEIHTVGASIQADQFALSTKKDPTKSVPRVTDAPKAKVAPPQLSSNKGTKIVAGIATMFDNVKTSEELLATLLDKLVKEGGFQKSAIIVISQDRKNALVVAARGPNIGNGQKLALDDPLSPLAQCFSKVQSWGKSESEHSPFGSKSFALSPINADHGTPVALYADCGNNGSISFEARRVFRTVVDLLNEKLPQIPGGIPNELQF